MPESLLAAKKAPLADARASLGSGEQTRFSGSFPTFASRARPG
ncbi:hypothetical protein BSU04_15400 [Caballeronia sordidicola]|uniref:Uncharacterized protein n=1 Tax=Caballeronia sordidicola TaxID=196367 RepID=A0A226X4F5_CABSO|nr:hypothetical protein BSU04_15400 [Caballeronia sordidicola]